MRPGRTPRAAPGAPPRASPRIFRAQGASQAARKGLSPARSRKHLPISHLSTRPSRVHGLEAWSAALRPCEGAPLTTQGLPASGSRKGVRGWTQDDRHSTPGLRSRRPQGIKMAQSFTGKKRIRKSFGRIPEAVQMPNLIEVQRSSYEQFLQRETRAADRSEEGIEAVFKSVFPIKDFNERAVLEYVSYEFEEPKYDVEECVQRDMTYAAPLKVKLRLIVFETDEETGARSVKDIKEQDVYMGDIPLMTEKGTFIVNGTQRVIVSQMHRSPGVFFDHDKGKTHASGKLLFAARVIPYRGSWLDFEFDAKDIVYVRIDRRRKLPATTFLMALGMDGEEILSTFYDTVSYEKRRKKGAGGWATPYKPERWRGVKPEFPLIDADTGEEIAPAGTKISARNAKKFADARPEDPAAGARGADRQLPGPRPGQPRDRRDLRRSRRRAGPGAAGRAGRAGLRHPRRARHRRRHGRRLHAQHPARRQEHRPRGRAVRHLPRHASGRAADGGSRRGDVQEPVLRRRALRPLLGRPREDEHAPGARLPRRRAHPAQGRRAGGAARPWSACATAAARSTTSTTSATAGSARSANCWRTSTASACCAWSARSRSA